MIDINKLKPCPFCGGKAKLRTFVSNSIPNYARAAIMCEACSASSEVFSDLNNDGKYVFLAINAWNARVEYKEKDPCSAATEQEPCVVETHNYLQGHNNTK